MRAHHWLAVAALGAALAAYAADPPDGEPGDGPSVGDAAPLFKLKERDSEKTVRLKSLRGKPTVLIFGSYT